MALTDIINGIVRVMNTVDNVGMVHAYRPYAADEAARKALFVSNGVLNTWMVTRDQTAAHDRGAGPMNVRDQHVILIEGYRAITAAVNSEQLHQELAEAIRTALHSNRKLPDGNGGFAGWLSKPSQVSKVTLAFFLRTFDCWYVSMNIVAEEIVQGG